MRLTSDSLATRVAIRTSAALAASYWPLMSPRSQLMGAFPYRARTRDKVVALTFDDGPNEPFTTQLADALAERDVRATFFQVARTAERHPALTLRIAGDGHVIGDHSYSHTFGHFLSPTALEYELRQSERVFVDLLGRRPALYRPPWMLRTPRLFPLLASHGLTPVSGDFCHPFEVLQPAAEVIARRALARAGPGAILIFHDGYDGRRPADRSSTLAAVKLVIDGLRSDGYRFTTVDRLLGLRPYLDR